MASAAEKGALEEFSRPGRGCPWHGLKLMTSKYKKLLEPLEKWVPPAACRAAASQAGPEEPGKLAGAEEEDMDTEADGQLPEKTEHQGENETDEGDTAQGGDNEQNSEKEQGREVGEDLKSEEKESEESKELTDTCRGREREMGKKKVEHEVSERNAASHQSRAPGWRGREKDPAPGRAPG